jgi:hypothetical protein
MTYQDGTVSRIRGVFTDTAGALVDPAFITCTLEEPNGTVATHVYPADADPLTGTLTRNSIGDYSTDVDLVLSGLWHYRFSATSIGNTKTAGEGSLIVRNTAI